MFLKIIKEKILRWIFRRKKTSSAEEKLDILDATEADVAEVEEKIQKFKLENIVCNKLNYLEQYIKIFSLTFPKEYSEYLLAIQNLKNNYAKELKEFQEGFAGNITFSVDPEHESKFYVDVIRLEENIKNFVELEVAYKVCRDKFSKLCYKLNLFYNALLDTDIEKEIIVKQLNNAYSSLETLVYDLKQQEFFERDSRKKDGIVNYIIYGDYIVFKASLRIGIISDFNEYKQEISKIYSFFEEDDYDKLIFNFFVENLEQLQNIITAELKDDKMCELVLKESQNLQTNMDDYNECFNDYTFFQNVIKFENTMYSLIKLHGVKFTFDVSQIISFEENRNEIISINNIAKSILSLVDNEKAMLLKEIVNNFSVEISWREFYFLCKIFELNKDVVETSSNTVFSMVKDKFLKLNEKYNEYSDDYIKNEKLKVLNYNGSKSKKYILLLKLSDNEETVTKMLNLLTLDFVVHNQVIYLNHSYFNGFKNLEENFGQYKVF